MSRRAPSGVRRDVCPTVAEQDRSLGVIRMIKDFPSGFCLGQRKELISSRVWCSTCMSQNSRAYPSQPCSPLYKIQNKECNAIQFNSIQRLYWNASAKAPGVSIIGQDQQINSELMESRERESLAACTKGIVISLSPIQKQTDSKCAHSHCRIPDRKKHKGHLCNSSSSSPKSTSAFD